MKIINLSDKEHKLLIKILDEAKDTRSDMSCNDAYSDEEKMFTKEERKDISVLLHGQEESDDRDGDLSNSDYVRYIIKVVE